MHTCSLPSIASGVQLGPWLGEWWGTGNIGNVLSSHGEVHKLKWMGKSRE